MNKVNINTLGKTLKKNINKRSPEILMGLGITGMVTSTVMAVRATPMALQLIDDAKEEYEMDELGKKEIVKTTWKCYMPASIVGGVSICCLLGSHSVNMRRKAAIATAYTISETALRDYQEKVKSTLGEEKEKDIKNAIIKDKIDAKSIDSSNNTIIITNTGTSKCYDAVTETYFESSINAIEKAINVINRSILNDGYASVNDLYYELGLPSTPLGDSLGWNSDKGLIDISFSSHIDDDDQPVIVLQYSLAPKYDY